MRLFATGAMSWVMDRALPDDVPIEARMVTRAIERAQNTVEQKNAEVRKDVLKYDEVMNEQRKVIYERRMQVIDGEDLTRVTDRAARQAIVDQVVADCCPTRVRRGVGPRASRRRADAVLPDAVHASRTSSRRRASSSSPRASSPRRSSSTRRARRRSPAARRWPASIERSVMLQIIDQRWRQHLVEMDYLREGIHLRGIAQTDPLVAWQREGFEMFGKLMDVDRRRLPALRHARAGARRAGRGARLRPGHLRGRGRPVADLGELAQGVVALLGGEVDPSPGAGRQARRHRRANGRRRKRRRRSRPLPRRPAASAPRARGRPEVRSRRRAPGQPVEHRSRSGGTSRAGAGAAKSSSSATARAERPWLEPPTTPPDGDAP